ncbi:MAG: hypothetical protein GX802_04690 [Clostridiales bacterium]|jgi:hypothetical protein|nr:hypothetical protein [Clostridiales bacterium]
MKNSIKIITLLLALSMLFVLAVACNDTTTKGDKDKYSIRGLDNTDNSGKDKNKVQLPENEFTALLPLLRMMVQEFVDNEYGTTVIYEAIESDAFNALYADAQESGFNIKASTDGLTFNAQNSDGYFIKIEVTDNATSVSVFNDIKHFN